MAAFKLETDGERRMQTLHDSNRYMLENQMSCDVIFKITHQRPTGDRFTPSESSVNVNQVRDVTPEQTTQSHVDDVTREPSVSGSDGALVPAHMYILRARCPQLAEMAHPSTTVVGLQASGETPLSEMRTSFEIELNDVTADVLTEVLRFLYYEKVRLTISNAFGVLYAVRKYSVPLLVSISIKYIHSIIAVKTVCRCLQQSLAYSEEGLTNVCTEFISRNTESVLNDPSFLRANEAVVDTIAGLDYLTIDEVSLFARCVQWARTSASTAGRQGDREGGVGTLMGEENRAGEIVGAELRGALGGVISNNRIRFPVMALEEFCQTVVRLDILDDAETVEVYNYLACPGRNKPDTRYTVTPRHGQLTARMGQTGGDRLGDEGSGRSRENPARVSTPQGMSSTVFRSVFFHW